MEVIKECAYIGGAPATPKIKKRQTPDGYPRGFIDSRLWEVRKATQHVVHTMVRNIEETARVAPKNTP